MPGWCAQRLGAATSLVPGTAIRQPARAFRTNAEKDQGGGEVMTQAREREVATGEPAGVGAGWILFAAIMMMVGGFFAFFEGLAAVLKGGRFYASVPNYPFGTNVKVWGWIVLIAGIIVLLAGVYVMRGALWARIVGITLASLSALANFFFIPFYPFWAIIIITLDIFVIWALAAHGKALAEA